MHRTITKHVSYLVTIDQEVLRGTIVVRLIKADAGGLWMLHRAKVFKRVFLVVYWTLGWSEVQRRRQDRSSAQDFSVLTSPLGPEGFQRIW